MQQDITFMEFVSQVFSSSLNLYFFKFSSVKAMNAFYSVKCFCDGSMQVLYDEGTRIH